MLQPARLKLPSKRVRPFAGLPIALTLVLTLALSGCASVNSNLNGDAGFASVERIAKQQLDKALTWQRSDQARHLASERVSQLLAAPLTVDDAVQLALLNHRGLQASFAELGIAESELVQAGRLTNPSFSITRSTQSGELSIERALSLNIAHLLALPYVKQMEQRRFEQTQREVAMRMLTLAAETRTAYYQSVAAEQSLRYMQQVKQAADAGAELAGRLHKIGNFNKLQQAREQSFYADAALNLTRAEQHRSRSREKLIRLLGLTSTQAGLTLPPRLPDLPQQLPIVHDLEQRALTQRLDVQAARLATEQLAANLGLTQATRFVNVLEFGLTRNSNTQQAVQRGYSLTLELPLFDWHTAKLAKAEFLYLQAVDRTAEIALNAASEVREATHNVAASYAIAKRYQDEIVPLKKRISDENQLRYNGMLIGVFDLLADARDQITSVNSAIEAQRDFWMAQAELDMSLLGPPASNSSLTTVGPSSSAAAPPPH